MAIYSVNQNRQFYVVENFKTSGTVSNLGDLTMGKDMDGNIFFKHMGKGGLTRTDLIDVDKICYAKITTAEEMQRKPKKAVVALNEDYLSNGKPIVGQDYILRIQVNNYLSPGDASAMIKSSAVHVTKGMTVAQFYEKMVDSLNKNFSRDPEPHLLKFKATDDGIEITEVAEQPWRLGVLSQDAVNFEVIPTTVTYDGEQVMWAALNDKGFIDVKEDTSADAIGNGRQIADIEYFCMAERGDMFRNMGWPNNIDVKYMVDPSEEYNVLDLHYYFSGNGVQVHKSEKDITFVSTGDLSDLKSALTDLGVKFVEAPTSEEEEEKE